MLKEKYQKEVILELKKDFTNIMAIPKISKVVLNVGFGRETARTTGEARRKAIELVSGDLAKITGQKALLTKAKKSIAGFKIRDGLVIGAKVTLRKQMMWDFLERLIFVALPRTRDFRGIELRKVDQSGNLNIGIKEHIVFPEIVQEKEKQVFGLQVTVNTTAQSKEQGLKLLKSMGFPFKKED